jgi:hypothetical protein
MKDDEYEKLADAIFEGNRLTIASLQDMNADDLHEVERAFRNKFKADINLNSSVAEIHFALGKIRSGHKASKLE